MTVEIYALACVVLSATITILQRCFMQQNYSHRAVLIFYLLSGSMLLVPFIDFSSLNSITSTNWFLLLAASSLWAVSNTLNLSALRYLDATQAEVFGMLRIVLITAIGVGLFHDHLSVQAMIGIGVILAAMVSNIDLRSISLNRGVSLTVIATIFGTVALSIDKVLLETVEPGIVVISAFLVPGLLLVLQRPSEARRVIATVRRARLALLILPVLGVLRYYSMVSAYQLGQLTTVTMILQVTVFIVFLLEVLILRVREKSLRRGLSATGCAFGAILVIV